MQTMNSTTNQLLTETYTSLCPIIIHYINRKINDYESARDMAQDVFLRLMEYKQILRKETVRSMVFFIAHNWWLIICDVITGSRKCLPISMNMA